MGDLFDLRFILKVTLLVFDFFGCLGLIFELLLLFVGESGGLSSFYLCLKNLREMI